MTMTETYTGTQLGAALSEAAALVENAAGTLANQEVFAFIEPALDFEPGGTYTAEQFSDMLNKAANDLHDGELEGRGYESSDSIWSDDVANLLVNAALYLLEHPGASLHEIIEAEYETDPDTVLSWVS